MNTHSPLSSLPSILSPLLLSPLSSLPATLFPLCSLSSNLSPVHSRNTVVCVCLSVWVVRWTRTPWRARGQGLGGGAARAHSWDLLPRRLVGERARRPDQEAEREHDRGSGSPRRGEPVHHCAVLRVPLSAAHLGRVISADGHQGGPTALTVSSAAFLPPSAMPSAAVHLHHKLCRRTSCPCTVSCESQVLPLTTALSGNHLYSTAHRF